PVEFPRPLRPESLGVRGRSGVDPRIRCVRPLPELRRGRKPTLLDQQRFQSPLDLGHGPLPFRCPCVISSMICTRPRPEQRSRRATCPELRTGFRVYGIQQAAARMPSDGRTTTSLCDNGLHKAAALPRPALGGLCFSYPRPTFAARPSPTAQGAMAPPIRTMWIGGMDQQERREADGEKAVQGKAAAPPEASAARAGTGATFPR